MREDLKERLERSLMSPGVADDHPARAGDGGLPAQDAFVQAFLRKAERVVYPAMLEIGRIVERHGRFFSIEYVSERETCRGIVVPTSVQMNFFRRRHTVNYRNESPHFNVSCDRALRRVLFSYAVAALPPGEPATPCGQCTLEQMSRDVVQGKMVATLGAVLKA